MQVQSSVQERYQAALAQLTARLEEDYYVLGAVIYGSLARGEAWERSDIDMVIILRDGQDRENRFVWLVEDDINISADVLTRNSFKRWLEGELQGSLSHSIRSQFKLLFCKDESITNWLKESSRVGVHDQEFQLLRIMVELPWRLDKAYKWLYVKRDVNYAFVWVVNAVNALARVEVVLNGEAPGREALDQALKFNPDFFQVNYIDLINGPKTEETIGRAIEAVDSYLEARAERICKPIFDYLAQANGLCTASELDAHFKKKVQIDGLGGVYEWMVRKGMIQKLSSPMHLTRKSQVTLEEPAYYYDKVDLADWE